MLRKMVEDDWNGLLLVSCPSKKGPSWYWFHSTKIHIDKLIIGHKSIEKLIAYIQNLNERWYGKKSITKLTQFISKWMNEWINEWINEWRKKDSNNRNQMSGLRTVCAQAPFKKPKRSMFWQGSPLGENDKITTSHY